jgi:fructosamine-3-kinase
MIGKDELAQRIAAATGHPFRVVSMQEVSGGSIHRSLCIENSRNGIPQKVFAKVGDAATHAMYEAEADGLKRLREAGTALRIPEVLACEALDDGALLLMEWIDMEPLAAHSAAQLGHGLASLHRCTAQKFGLARGNFIGATPQENREDGDWVSFWQHRRLHYQLQLAARNRYPARMIDRGERLAADCAAFFATYRPAPALLHGDLWGGNAAADVNGVPVIFDPAVYFGDREADLAMTELFGGFPQDFYAAYRNDWPLDSGYPVRKQLYNLYHILNHANLFSGGYVQQSERMIESLLSELQA